MKGYACPKCDMFFLPGKTECPHCKIALEWIGEVHLVEGKPLKPVKSLPSK